MDRIKSMAMSDQLTVMIRLSGNDTVEAHLCTRKNTRTLFNDRPCFRSLLSYTVKGPVQATVIQYLMSSCETGENRLMAKIKFAFFFTF